MDKWAELKDLYKTLVEWEEDALKEGTLDSNGKMDLMNNKHVLVEMKRIEKREEKEVIAEELKYKRFQKYQSRLREFLENFGIFSWSYDPFGVNLIFEGRFYQDYHLAENMGLEHYFTHDEDCEMFEIHMTWEYLRTIKHLWENVFKSKVI
ncbi:MAG: hypothetical protein K8E24_003105 [Methanobacterium paludis]|nr:hypothetical protein [Methanobacterium paludis]